MLYEIKLANRDSVIYETDMTLDELKNYISTNDFIELPIPCRFNEFGLYQTTSIVYINRDIKLEESKKHNQEIIDKNLLKVQEINNYIFNFRIKLWCIFNSVYWDWSDKDIKESNYFLDDAVYDKLLNKCKRYRCKIK